MLQISFPKTGVCINRVNINRIIRNPRAPKANGQKGITQLILAK